MKSYSFKKVYLLIREIYCISIIKCHQRLLPSPNKYLSFLRYSSSQCEFLGKMSLSEAIPTLLNGNMVKSRGICTKRNHGITDMRCVTVSWCLLRLVYTRLSNRETRAEWNRTSSRPAIFTTFRHGRSEDYATTHNYSRGRARILQLKAERNRVSPSHRWLSLPSCSLSCIILCNACAYFMR